MPHLLDFGTSNRLLREMAARSMINRSKSALVHSHETVGPLFSLVPWSLSAQERPLVCSRRVATLTMVTCPLGQLQHSRAF